VGLEPLGTALPQLLAWLGLAVVIVAGRALCLLAQRVPPLVGLVRLVRRAQDRQRHP